MSNSGYQGHNKLFDRLNRRSNLIESGTSKKKKKVYKNWVDRALSGYRNKKNNKK